MPEKTTEPGRKPTKKPKPEAVEQIPLLDLHPFPDHPFQVRDDDAMKELLTAKANIDRILELDKEQEEASERREKEREQR